MKSAGYETFMFGKWDVGMATPGHTPHGRGYTESLIYFHHDNDYWSSAFQLKCNGTQPTDLWRGVGNNKTHPEGPALGFNSTCTGMSPEGPIPPAACHPGSRGDDWWGGYEDSLFEQHVLNVIKRHDPSKARPFFIFWAPHAVHAPLQVPDAACTINRMYY
jgi:arylsulfatase I/J